MLSNRTIATKVCSSHFKAAFNTVNDAGIYDNFTLIFFGTFGSGGFKRLECDVPDHPTTISDMRKNKEEMCRYAQNDLGKAVCIEGMRENYIPWCTTGEGALLPLGLITTNNNGTIELIKGETGNPHEFIQEDSPYMIPLWQLVYHECMSTSLHKSNGTEGLYNQYRNKHDLYSMLYGEQQYIQALKDEGWAEDYDARVNDMIDRICKVNLVLDKVRYDEMTSHRFLTDDGRVPMTTFSSGVSVIVNFSNSVYEHNGIAVPSLGYLILDSRIQTQARMSVDSGLSEGVTVKTTEKIGGTANIGEEVIAFFGGEGQNNKVIRTLTGADGKWEISLNGIAAGNYSVTVMSNTNYTNTPNVRVDSPGQLTFDSGASVIFDFTGNTTLTNGSIFAVLQGWKSIATNGAVFSAVGLSGMSLDLSKLPTQGLVTVIPELK
jgi:hypothetical protein